MCPSPPHGCSGQWRPYQGRKVLGAVLARMIVASAKRHAVARGDVSRERWLKWGLKHSLAQVGTEAFSCSSGDRSILLLKWGPKPSLSGDRSLLLLKWGPKPSPVCTLCGHVSETQTRIQRVCPALKGARIRVHHGLAELLWGPIERATQGWSSHRESTAGGVDGLRGMVVLS
jgi:hypothetical protein